MKNKTRNKTKKQDQQDKLNPKFDPDMLKMKDMNQFVQQLSRLLVLWDIKSQAIDKNKTKKIPI